MNNHQNNCMIVFISVEYMSPVRTFLTLRDKVEMGIIMHIFQNFINIIAMKNTYFQQKKIISSHKFQIRQLTCIVLCSITFCSVLLGCSTPVTVINDPVTVTGFKLNTYVAISGYTSNSTKDILNEALNLCDKYEFLFSRTLSDSELYKVNHHLTDRISKDTAALIQYGIKMGDLSDGAFDITIGSVSQLWDFTADNPQVPDALDISEALNYINYKNIKLTPAGDETDDYIIDIPDGTVIDLGAIAKGYIADRIRDYLLEKNITSAIINLGGNVLCVGSKKNDSPFNIGIKKPFTQSEETLMTVKLNNKSAVSSGTYERYFSKDGNFYHHILNPKTGYPYNNGLTEVTIICDNSVDGDCLSTTCFVLGIEKGLELIESIDNTEAVFVDSDGKMTYSSGYKDYY